MGKMINFRASNNPCMFQFFKLLVHQTDKNEFYVDGTLVKGENLGVVIDFRNVEHTYEIFKLLGNYWGDWNSTPASKEMYSVVRRWEEKYEAEIIDISYDCIDFRLGKELSDEEIEILFEEIAELNAEANGNGEFEVFRTSIKEKSEFWIWWD